MSSLWTDTAALPSFAPLEGEMKTDVLIIGGGMAGLLCAYLLDQEQVDYALVEAGSLCSGITKNTTAKITLQHGMVCDQLIRQQGIEKAQMYYQANLCALEKYREMAQSIDCDFENKNNYVYTRNDLRKAEKELQAMERIHLPAHYIRDLPLPLKTAGAVCVENQAQFHPLKFLRGIVSGLNIYENTRVLEWTPQGVRIDRGVIHCKCTVATTHFPFINKHGSYFLKMYQHRSYVLALENAQDVNGMYVDEADQGLSFRNYQNALLLGGGDHRTGKQGGGWQELEELARVWYPRAKIVSRWATQDCMSLDRVPYIGPYSRRTKGLYVMTGFNKWGMSSSMVGAMLLKEELLGRRAPWAEVFSPSRSILRPQLAINVLESALNLLTPTAPRCPHLGCALKYNSQEHSWDCPCHGSRFTKTGKLIDNPATGDLEVKKHG